MNGDPVQDLQAQIVEARLSIGQTLIAEGKARMPSAFTCRRSNRPRQPPEKTARWQVWWLLDLIDLYDAQDRRDETKPLWERIRKILRLHGHKVRRP